MYSRDKGLVGMTGLMLLEDRFAATDEAWEDDEREEAEVSTSAELLLLDEAETLEDARRACRRITSLQSSTISAIEFRKYLRSLET